MSRPRTGGLVLALVSALVFATSGSFAKGLLEAGWSPAAAVTARMTTAALILAIPAVLALRGRWHLLRTGWKHVLLFGVLGVATAQLAYFQAVQHVPIGVALLLEYLGIIGVVGWLWLRHGQRPRRLSVAGSLLALAGLALVLDLFGAVQVSPIGVAWGLLAAVGLGGYFVVSADDTTGLPPIVLAGGGMAVGAALVGTVGAVGIMPMRATAADVVLAGASVPWWLAVLGLGLISSALAYTLGVAASRRLGSKVASFMGLTEVLFAVLIAWVLLGQMPAPIQLGGGLLIVLGVVAVKADERAPVTAEIAVEPLADPGDPVGAPDGVSETTTATPDVVTDADRLADAGTRA